MLPRSPYSMYGGRPVVDVPSLLTGFGLGVVLAFGIALLVVWRVGVGS